MRLRAKFGGAVAHCTLTHPAAQQRTSPANNFLLGGRVKLRVLLLPCSIKDHYRMNKALARDESNHMVPVRNVINISYSDLLEETTDLSDVLEAGFGPQGMGIVAISGVPGYSMMRKKLLKLAQTLSHLPTDNLQQLEDPASRYSFGWSHGKEILESGQPDLLKGSFYANPLVDVPTHDHLLSKRYPSYCRPNIWPATELPELQSSFKSLGSLIVKVGLQLSYHCDKHVSTKGGVGRLEQILRRSLCPKGRLLHYYPSNSSGNASSWCGWHVDHGSLTGLTCAMYMKEGTEVACPDPEAGLYVRTWAGAVVKATFGEDDIAYQMGEATEILTDGIFHATPHCVRAAQGDSVVERNTFAVFMQPNWDELLPQQKQDEPSNLTFGDFSESLLSKYYGLEKP